MKIGIRLAGGNTTVMVMGIPPHIPDSLDVYNVY